MFSSNKPQTVNQSSFHRLVLGIITLVFTACLSVPAVATSTPVFLNQTQPPATSIPTFTFTATFKPTITIAATPTLDEITALASKYNIPSVCLFTYLESSDHEWIGADCNLFRELLIAQKHGEQYKIPYQELPEMDPDYSTIHPLSWSADNRYFYFTPATRCCLSFSPFNSPDTYGSLYQYDTEKKTSSIVIRSIYMPSYFFSNDGKRYIYLNHHTSDHGYSPEYLEIGMVEPNVNKSKRIVLKYYWGPIYNEPIFAWSKNNERFAIVIYQVTFHPHEVDLNKILLKVDFTKMEMEFVEGFNLDKVLEE